MDYDYNRAIEYSKSELDNVKNVIKELEQYRESINQAINRVNKYFIGYEEVYRNSLKWAEYFKKDYIDFYNNIHKQLKKYGKISQKFSAIMLELGWPPSGKLYSEEKVEIVKAYDKFGAEGIKEKVDKYFIERFDFEELNNMFNIWSKKRWLSKRIPILKEALHAHFNKNYFSSIPTLLPQIEGAIADGYVGYLRGDTLKKLIKKLLNDEDEYSFDVDIQTFYVDIILADFKHGIAPNSYLSRHAILHGGDTSYGTIENSLKCILLFDYIQDKFRLVSVGSGNAYHIISCPVVQRNRKSEWNLFNYHWEAEEQNKKPCEL